ncbi:MAG: hypothetical protein KY476_13575 [Planctomycetes bacterium]|nr:hypothetical protein [Planctomycetota bacterium]
MAPNTALYFVLCGLSLVTLDARPRTRIRPAPLLATLVAAGSLLALVGYLFDSRTFYGVASYIPMAANTAAAFQILALGVLLARPECGPLGILTSDGAGGLMARRLLPVAVVVPLAFGWLRLAGQRAGLYDNEFGVGLMAGGTIFMFLSAVWWTGRALNRSDAARREARKQLEEANRELERRVHERTEELARMNRALERKIADHRESEEAVRQLNDQLEEQLAQLAIANAELAQQSSENEMFVYSVSHDLRSPLVNLQGFSQELGLVVADIRTILTDHELPPEVRERGVALVDGDMAESIRFIQTAVLRLSNIIDALLRLSRAGRVEYRPQQVDVSETVQRVVESMAGTIADRGASIVLNDLPPAWGDATAIEQVFANLIGNALNYLDPERPGEIEVGCTTSSTFASNADSSHPLRPAHSFYVRDNGLGIDAAYANKVFQAFQRLHPERAAGEGMGLAIVRRVVERHGGRIWLESTPGVGTTFFVELPARAPQSRQQQPPRHDAIPRQIPERNPSDGDRTLDHCVGGR